MAQHDYVIANGTGAAVRSDLNNALSAIVTQNSGSTAPATTYAYMMWPDTTAGVMKMRNGANSAWITLYQLDGEWTSIAFENGSAAAPSIYFKDSGTDTGFYSPGTDQVGISTGGTARLTIDASGNVNIDSNTLYVDASNNRVGLGTSSPSNTLHVVDSSSQFVGTVRLGGGSGSSGYYATIQQDALTTGKLAINTVAAAGSAHGIQLQVDGTSALAIDASRRVGIGTTSPARTLSVYSTSSIPCDIESSQNDNALRLLTLGGSGQVCGIQNSSGNLLFNASGSERARIDSSGRLLVGTSSASDASKFVVQGQVGANAGQMSIRRNAVGADAQTLGVLIFDDSSGNEGARIAAIGDAGWTSGSDHPTRLVFSTTADGASSPTERMRIHSDGSVTMGTTDLSGILSGGFALYSNASSDNHMRVNNTNSSFANGTIYISTVAAGTGTSFDYIGLYKDTDKDFGLGGDGTGRCDGSWTGGGADYAEYFEWSDGNTTAEDRRGISVVLDGDKIREAIAGEDPIGVISGNPSVVGDAAWNKWSGKHLRDEYGSYIMEEFEAADDDGNTSIQKRWILNPDFDPDQKYVSREQRPEWGCVGLLGKLRIRKGQVTGARWIKMRDISDSVEEWLVR
jgi:hypothetical protein